MREKCKFDFPLFKVVMAQMEREKKKTCSRAPARFLIPLRSAVMGDVASAPRGLLRLLGAVLKMRLIYICPLGVSSPRLQLHRKHSCSTPKRLITIQFQCLVVLTGFAMLLTNVTRIANTFFCTYESVEEHICNLFMRSAGKLLNL